MATKEIIAGQIIDFIQLGGSSITVATTGTVYSQSAPLPRAASFGIELQFTSPGTVDVIVAAEQANARPATEKAADTTAYVIPTDTAGSSVGLIRVVANELVQLINFSPMVSNYIRLKLTGQGSNNALTKLTRARLVYVK